MRKTFTDRTEAGRALAARLEEMRYPGRIVVLALPRGGVPIAAEIAPVLGAEMDLVLVRKIGAPFQAELAVAAIVDGTPPDIVIDEETSAMTGADQSYIDAQAKREMAEIERRRGIYLSGGTPVDIKGATVIVVDDGIATGTTMRAALKALRRRQPGRLVLAVPVAPSDTLAALSAEVDDIVCLAQPTPFHAIGLHYSDFHQVSDDEVLACLSRANRKTSTHNRVIEAS